MGWRGYSSENTRTWLVVYRECTEQTAEPVSTTDILGLGLLAHINFTNYILPQECPTCERQNLFQKKLIYLQNWLENEGHHQRFASSIYSVLITYQQVTQGKAKHVQCYNVSTVSLLFSRAVQCYTTNWASLFLCGERLQIVNTIF